MCDAGATNVMEGFHMSLTLYYIALGDASFP
jgi:methionine sulfoxide reductase catalytic subunit